MSNIIPINSDGPLLTISEDKVTLEELQRILASIFIEWSFTTTAFRSSTGSMILAVCASTTTVSLFCSSASSSARALSRN